MHIFLHTLVALATVGATVSVEGRDNARRFPGPVFPQACPLKFLCHEGVRKYRCFCQAMNQDFLCSDSIGEMKSCPSQSSNLNNNESGGNKNHIDGAPTFDSTREPKIQNFQPGGGHPPPQPDPYDSFNNQGDHHLNNNFNNRPDFQQNNYNKPIECEKNKFKAPQVKCPMPVGLIVVLVFTGVVAAASLAALIVTVRKYKQALHQIIHMNELYSAAGIDKENTIVTKLANK